MSDDDKKIDKQLETNVKKPEDKQFVTLENFEKKLAEARQEEKDKLYYDKKKQSEELKKLRSQNEALSKQMTQYEEFMASVKAAFGEPKDGDIEEQVNVDEFRKQFDAHQKKIKDLEKQQKESTELIAKLHGENQKAAVREMKDMLIKTAAKDIKFFPEMVSGETEQEILDSISKSAEVYKAHFGELTEKNKKLETLLQEHKNLTDAVTSTQIPSPGDTPNTQTALKNLIDGYATQIMKNEINMDDIPDDIWKKYNIQIQESVIRMAEANLKEQGITRTESRFPHQSMQKTQIGYKKYSKR